MGGQKDVDTLETSEARTVTALGSLGVPIACGAF